MDRIGLRSETPHMMTAAGVIVDHCEIAGLEIVVKLLQSQHHRPGTVYPRKIEAVALIHVVARIPTAKARLCNLLIGRGFTSEPIAWVRVIVEFLPQAPHR